MAISASDDTPVVDNLEAVEKALGGSFGSASTSAVIPQLRSFDHAPGTVVEGSTGHLCNSEDCSYCLDTPRGDPFCWAKRPKDGMGVSDF